MECIVYQQELVNAIEFNKLDYITLSSVVCSFWMELYLSI